jgi:hypothetical protein
MANALERVAAVMFSPYYIIVSIITWAIVFQLTRWVERRVGNMALCSSVNSLVMTLQLLHGLIVACETGTIPEATYNNIFNTSIGYFIIDSVRAVLEQDITFLVHHIIAVILTTHAVVVRDAIIDVPLVATEMTVPILNFVLWARKRNDVSETVKFRSGIVLITTFGLTRCIILPAAIAHRWRHISALRVPLIALSVLNLYWFTRLLAGALKMVKIGKKTLKN